MNKSPPRQQIAKIKKETHIPMRSDIMGKAKAISISPAQLVKVARVTPLSGRISAL